MIRFYTPAFTDAMLESPTGQYITLTDHVDLVRGLLERTEKAERIAELRTVGIESLAKELYKATQPTMFWNHDDPEQSADSIAEVIDREWANGSISVGAVLTIQRAAALENIQVRVLADPKDPDYFDYEIVEAPQPVLTEVPA